MLYGTSIFFWRRKRLFPDGKANEGTSVSCAAKQTMWTTTHHELNSPNQCEAEKNNQPKQSQECIVTGCVPSAIALHHPEWQPLYVWKYLQQFLPICEHSCRKTCNWDRDRVASHSNPCTEHICCEQHTGTCTGGLSPHWFCRGKHESHCSAVHPRKDPTHGPTVPVLSRNRCQKFHVLM